MKDVQYLNFFREFPERYLGVFTWYLWLSLPDVQNLAHEQTFCHGVVLSRARSRTSLAPVSQVLGEKTACSLGYP